ncbi:hypothetical protein HPB50_011149 [Hyalomma asiaticum]|uniref:Uncharacterized protein n=1 Tax=Hyalomma asiaticum TaxID=266040 RepID=A0ACB7RT49_HYAAI|nr:hypothetical protein HPB50_011149 [Hyalomma asiaticum]
MSFYYTMNISEKIEGSPVLSFQMSSGKAGVPCLQNVGSCSYYMCNGTNSVEEQINAPWNNECPIAPGSYENHLNITIPQTVSVLIEDSTLHVKIQAVNSDQEMGCVEFNVTLDGV